MIAEYERAKIHERTRRGRMHRMRRGEVVTGRRTFGYNYVSRTRDVPAHFETILEEAATIKRMFGWYTSDSVSLR
ncbi:MAG: hypothetical protein JRC99_12045 [Deltaproteobacteria bacterium]|nr:hypothetical protein [Deltaproteobacteria bacterium]